MSIQDDRKAAAAIAAMWFLPTEGVIGLGTGTTALQAISLIGGRAAAGGLVGVATSRATAAAAVREGIPLLDETGPWEIAVTFDGADEVSPSLDLIKGGGGALLREKIVNAATALNVIMVDDSKLSAMLGERCPLPVEVTRFGWEQTRHTVEAIAGPAALRLQEGAPFVTDNGNYILDVTTGPIADPAALEVTLEMLPGVVTTGLFVRRADVVIVAGPGGVEVRCPPGSDPSEIGAT